MTQANPQHQFYPLRIASTERDTDHALRVRFAIPAVLRDLFRFRPGQHLTLRTAEFGDEVRRNYTICSGPVPADGPHELSITIKRIDGGLFSNHANDSLRPGDTIEVMPPSGRFTLPAPGETPRTYLGIAAGSGITPIVSMIRHAMTEDDTTRFILIYGNRSPASILFAQPLDDLKDRHLGRLTIAHILSRDSDGDVPLLSGRIDKEKLEALLPKLVAIGDIDHAFLCGPDTLIKTAMQTLQGLGLPRERIHFEFFARGPRTERITAPKAPASPRAGEDGVELSITLDGARQTIRMQPDETILEAALRTGANAPFSCKGGMCCTCRARLVEGEAPMEQNYSLEPWEIERGFVLTCQAKPKAGSRRIAIDYDQM